MAAQRWTEGGDVCREVTSSHSYSCWSFFFCIPKILWVTLRSEWGHPTNRQNLDYNSESWHKWGEQPQAELEWMVVSSSALHHPDLSQGRRGSYEGCRPAFPSEYIVGLAHNSSFIQTLGNMAGSLEWGEFHEESFAMMRSGRELKDLNSQ